MRQVIATVLILICGVAVVGCKDKSDSAKAIPKAETKVSEPIISAADHNGVAELTVLIMTPDPTIGYAEGIKTLLSNSGMRADIVSWQYATRQLVDGFDVLIVTGTGRYLDRSVEMHLDYQKPIVAYGPYGCRYLGLLHLKNGHPYT